jgi:hypothetical protein
MITHWINKERVVWLIAALGLAAGGYVLGLHAQHPHAQVYDSAHSTHGMHMSMHAKPAKRDIPQTAQTCRAGAFLEADRILGSVIAVNLALPEETPLAARAELDSILYTGLQQAKSEVHCVAGVLTHGYDKAYAETVKKAVALAQQRKLSKDVIALGEEVVLALQANQPVMPAQPIKVSQIK